MDNRARREAWAQFMEMMMDTPTTSDAFLPHGVHVIVWPKNGWGHIDSSAIAADLVSLGCVGVIPQCSDEAPTWVEHHRAPLESAELHIAAGLGRVTAAAVLASLGEGLKAILDEEDWTHVTDANGLTDAVLTKRPDAPTLVSDMMYPAVVSTRAGHSTGHAAISKAFNRLCGSDRFPQCYLELPAIPDGAVARSLAWARDPSQWPSIGVDARRIRPTVQAYKRSVTDHLAVFRAEPVVIVWDYLEMDASCRVALLLRRQLLLHPEVSVSPIGPELAASLGVSVPPGVVWHRS